MIPKCDTSSEVEENSCKNYSRSVLRKQEKNIIGFVSGLILEKITVEHHSLAYHSME